MSHTHLSEDIFLFGGDKVLLVSFKRFTRCYSLSHNSFKYSAIKEDDMSETAFSKKLASSSPNLSFIGLSTSRTPNSLSFFMSGTTISLAVDEDQAMWPGNNSTSFTTTVLRSLAHLPHTPLEKGIKAQAGSP